MSVVFDFFKRRITEGGSSWWKETDFFAVLVNKNSEEIDSGSTTISSSQLEEVSGIGYYRLKTANHVVYQLDDSGRIVYSVDDLKWENSSISADGVLLVDGSDRPLIFIDFGYRRISESDLFSVVWGENGILYLDTTSSDIVDNGTTGTVPNQVSLTDAENVGSGVGVFSRILNKVKLQFRTIVGDKWIKVSNDGDTIGLKLNTDFLVAGDNVKLTASEDGTVKIDVVVKNSGSDNLSTEIKDKLDGLIETVDDHISNEVIHITQTERDLWNSASGNVGGSGADHNNLNNLQGGEPTYYGHNTELMQYRQTQAGSANGYALLTSGGYIPTSVIPDSFFGIYTLLVGASGLDYFMVPNPAGTSDVSFTAYDVPSKTSVGLSLYVSDDVVSASDLVPFTQDNQLKIVMISGKHQNASTGLLLRIDVAEVSMLCLDGSDGKGNEFVLTAVGSTSSLDYLEWTSSDNSIATVEKVSSTSAIVRGVSKIGTGLGSDVYITCTQGSIQRSCLFTVYETMPRTNSSLITLKGGAKSDFVFNNLFNSLVTVNNLNSHLMMGICNRNSGGVGPVSRVNGNGSTCFDVGGTSGEITLNFVTYSGSVRSYSTRLTSGSVIPTGLFQYEIFCDGSSIINVNGLSVSTSSGSSFTDSTTGRIQFDFSSNRMNKLTIQANATAASLKSDVVSNVGCGLYHCMQNYIRYSDTTYYTNYTVIPNIGTLGSAYDLTANNVPAAWFGV